ncbi:type II toxin-antitoxin system RelE/ParE family toxin [Patescibacteria group bacterium]|nr:type II toxin-antitoxin system RelE/ParE family toxin [Patescibacteria group bacterium]MBU4353109.1 type II toxin-antitoxin system RelE/ParE family toxin [Patescibacteria group bacterium]MBU4477393.1 type II toxin-antitoxin system RelE/ParE family toxin [Patescibacteria group bacterium]MCG2698873.1 type II toxin-antitoxin system RelE/ParE family toxin [Candidatus Parcubacteria bacterium]
MKIVHTPKFERTFKKLPVSLAEKIIERTLMFEKNPFDSRLETHKLHGKLKEQWSFSIDKKYRILFEFDNSDVVFLDVGDHNLYK